MLAQQGADDTIVPGKDGVVFQNIRCHHCQKYGHYSLQCPAKDETETKVGKTMTHSSSPINKNWILLDTCSTHSVSNNPHFVKNLRKCKKFEELVKNGFTINDSKFVFT